MDPFLSSTRITTRRKLRHNCVQKDPEIDIVHFSILCLFSQVETTINLLCLIFDFIQGRWGIPDGLIGENIR